MTPEQEGKLAAEFLSTSYFRELVWPYIDTKKKDIEVKIRAMIYEDAPKNRFSVLSGEYKALADLLDHLETLSKR